MRTNLLVAWHNDFAALNTLFDSEGTIQNNTETISAEARSSGVMAEDTSDKINIVNPRISLKRKDGETKMPVLAEAETVETLAKMHLRAFGTESPDKAEGIFGLAMMQRMIAPTNWVDGIKDSMVAGDRVFLIKKTDDSLPTTFYHDLYADLTSSVSSRSKSIYRSALFCNAPDELTNSQITTGVTNVMSTQDAFFGTLSATAWGAFDKSLVLTGSSSGSGHTYKCRIYTKS